MGQHHGMIEVIDISLNLMRRVWTQVADGAEVGSWRELAAGLEAEGVGHDDSVSAAVRLFALRNTALIDDVVAMALANPMTVDAVLTAAAGMPSVPLAVGPGFPIHFVPLQLLSAVDEVVGATGQATH